MLLYQRVSHNIPIFDFTQNGRTWPYPTPASLFRGPFKHRTTSSLGDTRTWQELPPTYLGVKTNIGMKKNMGKVRKKWCVGESIRISWCFISTYIYMIMYIYIYLYMYVCIYMYIFAVHGSFLKADLFRRQDSSPHGQRCNQVPILRIVRASFSNVFSNQSWLIYC